MEAEVAPVAAKAINPIRGISWKTQVKKQTSKHYIYHPIYPLSTVSMPDVNSPPFSSSTFGKIQAFFKTVSKTYN